MLPKLAYQTMNGRPIEIINNFQTTLRLEILPNVLAAIELHVLKDISPSNIIIGRDFLMKHKGAISC